MNTRSIGLMMDNITYQIKTLKYTHMIKLQDYDAQQQGGVFKLTIINIICMTSIIIELLNTLTLKTRQNTTPADPNCVNFQQCIPQTKTTECAFRWKTPFLQTTQDIKYKKKKYILQTKFSLCMKAYREEETQLHPSITSTLHRGQWLDKDIICFLYTTDEQPMVHRPHFAC